MRAPTAWVIVTTATSLLAAGVGGAGCLFPDLSNVQSGASDAPSGSDVQGRDDAGDASAMACDPARPFTSIQPLAELNTTNDLFHQTLTDDELEIWYGTQEFYDGGSRVHVMHAARANRTDLFGAPTIEAAIDSDGPVDPAIDPTGLGVFYAAATQTASYDLFVATRSSLGAALGTGFQLPQTVQSDGGEIAPFVDFAGNLYFVSDRSGDNDIWVARTGDAGLLPPTQVTEVDTPSGEIGIALSRDALWAYVASDRTDLGTKGGLEIFLAHRGTTSDPFGPLVNQVDVNSADWDRANWLSPDGCRLYFESRRDGPTSLYVAEKSP